MNSSSEHQGTPPARGARPQPHTILTQLPAIVWTVDQELRFTSSVGAGLSALGLRENQLQGMLLREYFQADESQPPLVHHRRALQGESVEFEFEWQGRWYQVRLEPLRNAKNQIEGVLGLAVDITDLQRLQEQAERATRLESIGRLAGGIAHDFNNILTAIEGFAELALLQLPEEQPAREPIQRIRRAVESASQLISQLLAFARRRIIAPQPMSINEHLRYLEPFLQRLLGEDIELQLILDDATGTVRADPAQIEQVLMNLASNARHAMPDGGKLLIETQNVVLDEAYTERHWGVQPGEYVLISLTDTGHGIREEDLAHIFEPFYTTRPEAGTGLGLATVHGIISQARGHIWVYSEVGKGTTFKIYLPRIDEPAQPLRTPAAPAEVRAGSATILFVEDNAEVRSAVGEMLRALGYTVLEADRPSEALRLAAAHKPDLLLTDVVLPEMRGAELARALALLHPDIQVLFTSGFTENTIIEQHELQPGVAFLPKPFTLAQLSAKIRQLLNRD